MEDDFHSLSHSPLFDFTRRTDNDRLILYINKTCDSPKCGLNLPFSSGFDTSLQASDEMDRVCFAFERHHMVNAPLD